MNEPPRLQGISIDVPHVDHARAVEFWSAAFGREPVVSDRHPDYAQFADVTPGCYVLIQDVGGDTARVHLDFATTQRDADADRLVVAGAQDVTRDLPWAVLRDPVGMPLCLCPVEGCM